MYFEDDISRVLEAGLALTELFNLSAVQKEEIQCATTLILTSDNI